MLIGGLPASVLGDLHTCSFPPPAGPHPPSPMTAKAVTVLIGGSPAVTMGDLSGCGASVLPPGCPTVLIGG